MRYSMHINNASELHNRYRAKKHHVTNIKFLSWNYGNFERLTHPVLGWIVSQVLMGRWVKNALANCRQTFLAYWMVSGWFKKIHYVQATQLWLWQLHSKGLYALEHQSLKWGFHLSITQRFARRKSLHLGGNVPTRWISGIRQGICVRSILKALNNFAA